MVIILNSHADENDIQSLSAALASRGHRVFCSLFHDRYVLSLQADAAIDEQQIKAFDCVDRVVAVDTEYRLANRAVKPEGTRITVGQAEFGGSRPVVIAGPCSVENREQMLRAADIVARHGAQVLRAGAFKPRTSPYSFQGLEERGLELLAEARERTGLPIITEVLDAGDVDMVAGYADILQIGSRNMKNYKLLKAVGALDKPVMLKRGMASELNELLLSAEYILSGGNGNIILCERGIRTFSDFSRNTLDLNIVPAVKQASHLPIIVDPSHGTGRRDLVAPMSLAALACGADGLIVEVHPEPERSLSDADQAIGEETFARLMSQSRDVLSWRTQHDPTPVNSFN